MTGAGLHGAQTDRTYDRAGFGAAVPLGPRPALVVVDLTRGFTEPSFSLGADLSEVVAANRVLVDAAHSSGVPVVFTAVAYTRGEIDGGGIAWLRKAPGLAVLHEGSEASALDPRLPVDAGDHLVVKKGASAFFGTPLAALLTGLRVTTTVVTGATTSGCVRASVVDALQYGFDVLVPRPAVGDRADGPHEAALFDIAAKYADVVDLETARAYLDRREVSR